MKHILHKAQERGHVNFGWLDSHHSFSFGHYYDPHKVNFGALRVLNDDIVLGGQGFGEHPHDNMEIISIPLKGELAHKDSTGTAEVIRVNDVQIMSAGDGIRHSEFNNNKTDAVNFLQIWIMPKQRNIKPRYDQKTFNPADRTNVFQTVVSPREDEQALWINQDAWLAWGDLDGGSKHLYKLNAEGNGVYVFLISGSATVNGVELNTRDAVGIWETESLTISTTTQSQLLLIEVPMKLS